ncbi:MAG: helix-turn-helix domain-containing protein [Dehalococcoidia bacterium]
MVASYPWQSLGSYLRDARHRTGFTQYFIAQSIRITQSAYSQIERGQIRPRPPLLVSLALLLGLSLFELATLAGYPIDEVVRTLVAHVDQPPLITAPGSVP